MREAYLQNSRFERFLVFQAKSKANASFNYGKAQRFALVFLHLLRLGEGTINNTVKASEYLYRYRKWIDLLNYTVLTKDERLVVTTMLFNNTTMRYLQSLVDFGF